MRRIRSTCIIYCDVSRVDANHVLLVSTAVVPVCMVIIPLCRALSGLAFILGVMGLCMGCIDCLANLQMINVHGNAVAPFLHVSSSMYRKKSNFVRSELSSLTSHAIRQHHLN